MAERNEPARAWGPPSAEPRASTNWIGAAVVALLVTVTVVFVFRLSAHRHGEAKMARFGVPAFGVVAALGLLLARRDARALLERVVAPIRTVPGIYLGVVAGLLFVAMLFIARVVLCAFPNSGDEYAYVLQAETYARGKLWVPAPVPGAAFNLIQFVQREGHWISIYQPGWAVLLMLPMLVGLPAWLVNPVLGGCAVWAFYGLARRYVRRESALLATMAVGSSAFFLLNYSSFMSHGAGALAAILFALCGSRYLEEGTPRWALLAGLCLGALGFIRAANAVVVAVPLVLALVLNRRRWVGLLWLALGGLPLALALLAYNKAITGNPFLVVQQWGMHGREPIGAPSSHTFSETGHRLVRLYLWTSPVLMVGSRWRGGARSASSTGWRPSR
jgi:hypothetical protein